MMHWIVLFYGCLAMVAAEKVISFQEDNKPTTASRVSVFLDHDDQGLGDFSVCLWFSVSYFRTSSYAFSYALSQERNNELGFYILPNRVSVVIRGKYMLGTNTRNIMPNKWYHACVTSTRRTTKIYFNGKLDSSFAFRRSKLSLSGSLVFGQETDDYNGGFQVAQSFSGKVTNFNIYNKTLTERDVLRLSNCGVDHNEKVIDWETVEWNEINNVTVQDINIKQDICNKKKEFIVVLEKKKYKSAKLLCQLIGSQLSLPRNDEENEYLYKTIENYTDKCKPQNHATGFFWIGAKYNGQDWTDSEGNVAEYNNMKNGSISLPTYHTLEEYSWRGTSGNYQFCFACDLKNSALTLRGLCSSSKHDHKFTVAQKTTSDRLYFRGYTKYNIMYEEEDQKWYLRNTWADINIASWFSFENEYPLGLRSWTVLTNHRLCDKNQGNRIKLMLSVCGANEFACEDGSCVKLDHRCNQERNCLDGSDELNCRTIHNIDNYMSSLPPPKIGGEPLNLNTTINIHGLSEVDILNLKLTVDFTMSIMWLESRVSYANLKNITDMNSISQSDELWLPQVEFINADFPNTNVKTSLLSVVKWSRPEKDDLSLAINDEIFLGFKNPVMVTRKVNAPFYCNMDLSNFPFDTQTCVLKIRMTSAHKENAEFDSVNTSYLGETLLTEYKVGDIQINVDEVNHYSLIEVTIPLTRRYWYYITTAYIPILMMIIISYSSLYIRYESVDLRVMLSITTLLVLYSLYQQISNGLPKTSYIKSFDIWSFFAICYIFSIVIFHVAITDEENKVSPDNVKEENNKKTTRRVVIIGKLFYSLVLILFITFYIVDAVIKTS